MSDVRRLVVQVGDIARVAEVLSVAMQRHTDWAVANLDVSKLGLGRSSLAAALTKPIRVADMATRVSRSARVRRPDVIHAHWALYASSIVARRIPLVVHAHGSDVRGWKAGWNTGLEARVVRRTFGKAAAVIVSTPDLLADVPPGARYVPNPIDCDFWTPGSPAERENRNPTVMLHARLTRVKGAADLLYIARSLKSERPGLRIVALGGTDLDQSAVDTGVDVLPLGTGVDVREALRCADVVIGQQLLRTVGLSELEALACGKPVVMPLDVSLYGDDLPIADAGDADGVVASCLELLDDPSRRRDLGLAGRDYVAAVHGLERFASLIAAVYEDII